MGPLNKLESLPFENSFLQLGTEFFQAKFPDPVSEPYLVEFNPAASRLIGLDSAESERKEFVDYFSGNASFKNTRPLAMVYSGHQFGVYNPRLGDGRGLLLGELSNGDGIKWDVHLKGCGPTRFARGFDGRATLRSSIREYLGGEAVHGLGIPTTRSLAVIGIRELIYREMPELGAVLVRLSDSHIRFGTFQYFFYNNKPGEVTNLADYVIWRNYPDLEQEADKYRLFFRTVLHKTAHLISLWQAFGFIHGVMNTDNMSITGATFDYGPYGFMDRFNPYFTPNHSDTNGRYAFGKQPEIAYWNLGKLGEALTHLVGSRGIQEELDQFQPTYNRLYREKIAQKLGLNILDSEFTDLVGRMFQLLYENQADYTNFFRSLSDFPNGWPQNSGRRFKNEKDLESWLSQYLKLLEREGIDGEERKEKMNRANPRFILRNYLLQRAVDLALKESDFSEIRRLRILLEDPYSERADVFEQYGIDPEFYAAETPDSLVEMQMSCSA